MRRILLLGPALLALCAATLIAAPRATDRAPQLLVHGTVRDAATARPLAGAQVLLVGTRYGALSDAAGRYRFAVPRGALPRGAVLRAQLIGYAAAEVALAAAGDEAAHDFRLAPLAVQLDELRADAGRVRRRADAGATLHAAEAMAPASVSAGSAAPTFVRPQEAWNTEAYDPIAENRFVAAAQRPLSTFSIDVDRASYTNVRRFLREGRRPPQDAVRVEEMINYFAYDYPEPRGGHPVSLSVASGDAPWQPLHRLVRIGLRSRAIEMEGLPPSNLVFLVDVSGSMAPPDRLPLARRALRLLVEQLRPEDRVALVVYAGAAGVVLPSTPGSEKETILDAIERLEAGGATAGGAGLRLAYEIARQNHLEGGNNRVVLATDGDFNIGPSSDGEMVRLVEAHRAQGTHLTVLGFGRGNLKDAKMEKLAGHGNGNYAYIDDLAEARRALVAEAGATLLTVASDVKLQVEFNPARVRAYRLIGYENRLLADEDFNDDARDAGDLGAGHSVTALYEVVPAGVEGTVALRGVDARRYAAPPPAAAPRDGADELAFVKLRYRRPGEPTSRLLQLPVPGRGGAATGELGFAAAVAGFGMLLRDSEHRGTFGVDDVLRLARASRGPDADGRRAEFIDLVQQYRRLAMADDAPEPAER